MVSYLPLHISPGSDTAGQGYSTAWLHQGDLYLEPTHTQRERVIVTMQHILQASLCSFSNLHRTSIFSILLSYTRTIPLQIQQCYQVHTPLTVLTIVVNNKHALYVCAFLGVFTSALCPSMQKLAPVSRRHATHFLPNQQRPLTQRLSFLVLAPLAIQHGQVVQRGGHLHRCVGKYNVHIATLYVVQSTSSLLSYL